MDIEPKYEEQLTGYIDLLGFTEASQRCDEPTRLEILRLLQGLAAGRGEFDIKSASQGAMKSTNMRAAISTFSDHIVVSYPLSAVRNDVGPDERLVALHVLNHFGRLITALTAATLRIGFLVRGGASIGQLYHSNGIIFGPALIDAYMIESRTSVYPRVVLSSSITNRPEWLDGFLVSKDDDGLYHIDYFKLLMQAAVPPGPNFKGELKTWFGQSVSIIERNLRELRQEGRLSETAKWTWFAHRFRASFEKVPEALREAWSISLADFSW